MPSVLWLFYQYVVSAKYFTVPFGGIPFLFRSYSLDTHRNTSFFQTTLYLERILKRVIFINNFQDCVFLSNFEPETAPSVDSSRVKRGLEYLPSFKTIFYLSYPQFKILLERSKKKATHRSRKKRRYL